MKKDILNPSPPSVLVIDDEHSICQFFVDLFNEIGINIETEQTGAAGLESALKNSYSLIFLDVKLGDMSGIDVLRSIKASDLDTKVVVISGYLTESLIEEAMKMGVDGYLYKPLAVRDIVSLTHKFVDLNH
ncbi:MAG: response regulator [Candidatus Neomarinimicrobiota bacterium]